MSDFQTADIDELLNIPEDVPEEKRDINALLDEADREMLRFSPRRQCPVWPSPIRKRICTK